MRTRVKIVSDQGVEYAARVSYLGKVTSRTKDPARAEVLGAGRDRPGGPLLPAESAQKRIRHVRGRADDGTDGCARRGRRVESGWRVGRLLSRVSKPNPVVRLHYPSHHNLP